MCTKTTTKLRIPHQNILMHLQSSQLRSQNSLCQIWKNKRRSARDRKARTRKERKITLRRVALQISIFYILARAKRSRRYRAGERLPRQRKDLLHLRRTIPGGGLLVHQNYQLSATMLSPNLANLDPEGPHPPLGYQKIPIPKRKRGCLQ